MASPGLNEESVEKRLMSVTNTQDSIQGLSLWIIHHKTHHVRIVELWYKVMKKSVKPSHRLTLFYLCNDVVQTCKRKKALIFIDSFKPLLRQATALVRDVSIKPKVERIFTIWEERQVFDKDFVADLKKILDGKRVEEGVFKKPHSHKDKAREKAREKAKEKAREKKAKEKAASPISEDFDAIQPADATLEQEKEKEKAEDLDAPSEEILATFKPTDMIEKIRTFKHQEAEVEIKVRQLSHLKLDASSIEAIKQLKDRAHGNEFSTQFEESCLRLEEAVRGLEKTNGEQKDLMAQLHTSEYFYDQQYREARIVANAYKNYGARINTMKRKLDELMRTLPSSSPPLPQEAPSPGNTPPHLDHRNAHPMDMDMDMDPSDNQPIMGQTEVTTRGRVALTTTTRSILKPITSIKELIFADDDIPSPPDEAPSPVGSSPEDNGVQIKGSSSLDNRLASFIPSLHSGSSSGAAGEERPIPVYVPQPLNSNGSSSARRPSANKTLTEPEVPFPEEEGGATPLTDEQPSTPVMDEEPGGSPSPPPPPPPEKKKKENPIDFLSRLISQTQKSKPLEVGSSSSSFLESFNLLTSKVKEQIELKKVTSDEDSNPGGSPGPKSWAAWKAEKAAEDGSGMDSSDMCIPPPPIPNFAVPPPPPPSSLAPPVPPLGMPPVLPMPVPPPGLTSPTSPFYQHTSPGQKENWPEVGEDMGDGGDGGGLPSPNIVYPPVQGEMSSPPFPPLNVKPVVPVKGILRKTSHSVLKELTPSSDADPSPSGPVMVPPPPPPLPPASDMRPPAQPALADGSAISTVGSGSNSEALEFKEKLKRKTSVGGSAPAYTPNPIRPNLMTLTPGGEMDMDLDEEEEEEEEEEEDESARIPVLSSVVRRVDPVEQKQAREKEMQQLRERDTDKHQHSREPRDPSSSSSSTSSTAAAAAAASSQRGDTFHKERRYSRDGGRDDYFPAFATSSPPGYEYRDNRSYPYGAQQPDPYYPPYAQNSRNFYGEGPYNSYPYSQPPPKRAFPKHGNPGSRRSYHY